MKQQNRGKNIALVGAVLQSAFTVVLLIVALRTRSLAAMATMWYLLGGVPVWLMTAMMFYCRKLEIQEQQELDELAARGESGGIFERERDLSLRPAAARVRFIDKWIVPSFTLLMGGYYGAMGLLVLAGVRYQARYALEPLVNIAEGMLFVIIPGFLAFLFSRYCTGMGSQRQWRPFRPAASQLLLGTLFIAAVLCVFGAGWRGYRSVDLYVALAMPAIAIMLAVELGVTFLLDIFRPRAAGEERRLTYDSRILGLLAEPTRIGNSIAETLNYQFGFEVSKTWFYRLLGRALVPLVILGAVVLWALSSVVIVRQGQKGVVLHWGRAQAGRLLEPGLSTKWPWPIDSVRIFDTGMVHDLQVGVGEARKPTIVNGKELQLWTQQHGAFKELPFLLAIPSAQGSSQSGEGTSTQPGQGPKSDTPPPVNIINLVLSVQYRIADPYKFGYKYVDAGKMLEDASYREMVRYCASATLDTTEPGVTDRPQAIMTSGWADASKALQERIAKAVGPVAPDAPDALDLGVDVASVKLTAVHPPAAAAEDFEAILAAERNQDRLRYEAEGEANKTLAAVAGDPDSALELAMAIRRVEQLDSLANLRQRPAQFDQYLRGYVRQCVESLKLLRKEIVREGLLGRIVVAEPQPGRAGFAKLLRQRMDAMDKDMRAMIEQILDWPMLDELGPGQAPKQRLAAQQVENLVELLTILTAGTKFDFAPALAAAHSQADGMFARAAGDSARLVAEAGSYKVRREMAERTRAERFQRELDAWKASPNMYVLDRRLDVWDEVLPGMIKYVIGVDPSKIEVWMNWERESRGMEGAFQGAEGGNK